MNGLKEVAERAGVSINTASRVLTGKTKGLRRDAADRAKDVLEAAAHLGYRPDATARAMRQRRTRQIGLVTRNTPDHRFHNLAGYEAVLGINERLEQDGYILSLIRIGDVRSQGASSRILRERLLDGIIMMGWLPDDVIAQLSELYVSCIHLDTNIWRPTGCIRRDEYEAGRITAQRLVDGQCEQLLWVGYSNPPTLTSGRGRHHSEDARLSGVRSVAEKYGLALRVIDAQSLLESPQSIGSGCGIAAYNTLIAQVVFNGLSLANKSCGRHFTLACCDDTSELWLSFPPLSRTHFDRFNMGLDAADMLLKTLAEPDKPQTSQLVPVQWVEGTTDMFVSPSKRRSS